MTTFGKILIGLIVLGLIGAIVFFIFGRDKTSPASLLTVTRKDIVEEIAVTGQLKAKKSLELSFETAGKVTAVYPEVGEKVKAGQALIVLDNTEFDAQLKQAESQADAARAEVTHASAQLRMARRQWHNFDETPPAVELDNVYRTTENVLSEAYEVAYDAVYTATDELFVGASYDPFSIEPISFPVSNSSRASRVERQRQRAKESVRRMEDDKDSLPSRRRTLVRVISGTVSQIEDVQRFLDDLAELLEYTESLSSNVRAAYKTSVSNARAALVNTLTAVQSHRRRIDLQEATTGDRGDTQELSLRQAEALIQTSAAQFDQAEQQIRIAQSRTGKTIMTAPGEFIVSKIERKVSEVAPAFTPILTLISPDGYLVEVNVPEVDINRISVGDTAEVTFDALGSEEFKGTVIAIEPAETVIDGVVSYKVTIALDKEDERLRSGFTTNLRIQTDLKENVLVVPTVAILENDKGTFAKVVKDGEETEVPVVLGVTDQAGMIEVIFGLSEGDSVVNVGIIQE